MDRGGRLAHGRLPESGDPVMPYLQHGMPKSEPPSCPETRKGIMTSFLHLASTFIHQEFSRAVGLDTFPR
jgi:hypothetical protein